MNDERLDQLLESVQPRTALLATVALLAIAVLAGVLYGIKPLALRYADLQEEYVKASELVAFGEGPSGDADVAALEREIAELRDELYGASARIPRREIEAAIVDALDDLSMRHGIRLLAITPAESSEAWMFEELPYRVEVEGRFFDVHHWLHDVERELRPMVIKQFEVAPQRGGEGVVLELRVVAYRVRDEVAS